MPPASPPSSTPPGVAGPRGMRVTHAKAALHGEHENVQRFRSLMRSRQQPTDGSTPSGPDEEDTLDVDLGAHPQADESAGAAENELSLDQEQALRDLLQRQLGEGRAQSPVLASRDQGDDGGSDQQDERRDGDPAAATIGLQALHLVQQAVRANAEQPAAGQAALAPALAELIERHVKQLLVPDTSSRSAAQAREIMITLKNGLLPGTELWLSRTSNGWQLRADTRSESAYRSLVEGAPQLIERFAQSKLGALEVTPTLLT
ncbi:type III secretion HpaP family protein [Dyella choica]|uniref:Uncharacterized protein n=1 Tax=Dyella choica TaxID=1927959 RepID=A0A432MBF3_9GAMM|nr:type III secretion HpaP family protein [Dyella choica]RUL79051.1 hypothetical protein EKH80_04435 [Dyella choica]